METNYKNQVAGFVLAAGYGSRLRPITNEVPKPLIKFLDKPIIEYSLELLKRFGISKVAVNGSYKAELLQCYVESQSIYDYLFFSNEGEEPKGTGGCYPLLSKFRSNKNLLCLNGDVVADFNLDLLINSHFVNNADVSMYGIRTDENLLQPDRKYLWANAEGQIVSISNSKPSPKSVPFGFACAQVIGDRVLSEIPLEEFIDIIPFYQDQIEKGSHLQVLNHSGFWGDLGTPIHLLNKQLEYIEYTKTNKATLNKGGFERNFLSRGADVAATAQICDSILESGSSVGAHAKINNSLILDGAIVHPNQNINSQIIGKDFTIKL